MADALTTITDLIINSLPGQLTIGFAIAGGVAKGFKHIGDLTSEQTNREIARWLRVKHFETGIVAGEAVNWPDTFASVFDRVFGERHLTWRCFFLSAVASYALVIVAT